MAAREFMASTLQGRRWEIQAFLTAATLAHSFGRNRVACETWAFSPAGITVQHLPSTALARLQVRPTPTTPCTPLAGRLPPDSKIWVLSPELIPARPLPSMIRARSRDHPERMR